VARNVVFAAPFPAEVTHRFVRAARDLDDVRLLGLVHVPPGEAGLYHDVERISDPLDGRSTPEQAMCVTRSEFGGEPSRATTSSSRLYRPA
jgi:hypothetical protein